LLSRLVPSKGFSYASSFPRLCLAHSTTWVNKARNRWGRARFWSRHSS
jgi:hypothetical protein